MWVGLLYYHLSDIQILSLFSLHETTESGWFLSPTNCVSFFAWLSHTIVVIWYESWKTLALMMWFGELDLWTKINDDQGSLTCLTDANKLADYRIVSAPGQRRSEWQNIKYASTRYQVWWSSWNCMEANVLVGAVIMLTGFTQCCKYPHILVYSCPLVQSALQI